MVEGRTLFIRNLPFIVTEEELQERYVLVCLCMLACVCLCVLVYVCGFDLEYDKCTYTRTCMSA